MNAEALQKTIATGEAWYFSRSRRALWRKGETSGHVQRVVEMRIDCDQDAVWIRVEQDGPGACHTGRRSCFYRAVPLGRTGAVTLEFRDGDKTFDPKEVYGGRVGKSPAASVCTALHACPRVAFHTARRRWLCRARSCTRRAAAPIRQAIPGRSRGQALLTLPPALPASAIAGRARDAGGRTSRRRWRWCPCRDWPRRRPRRRAPWRSPPASA